MFGSTLEVVIGLIFVFLVLSLVCSGLTEFVALLLSRRAHYLEQWVVQTLGSVDKANRFLDQPLIRSLVPPSARTGLRSGLSRLKSLHFNRPSDIPARTFAKALLNFVDPSLRAPTERRQIDAAKKRAETAGSPEVATVIEFALLEAKQDFTRVLDAIEKWFDDSMNRVGQWYRHWSKAIVFAFAVVLALALNADTINITSTLWNDPTVRAAVVAAAQEEATRPTLPTAPDSPQEIATDVNRLRELRIPLGWKSWDAFKSGFNGWLAFSKILGLTFTVAALMLGAPFWFDFLKRLTTARAGQTKEVTPAT
jgi:hypothetical protein